ncbi:MAG: hypothetical protein RL068_974 [Actinomycetota bacterium]|jgi:hypothetical protein
MRFVSKSLSLALLATLTLAGCSASPAPEVTTAAPTATQTEEPTPEPVYLTAPLTGVQYLEGTNPFLELPAVSAKIDNTYSGRPQLALNDADMVFVTRVEGGMTRLLPVWHSRMPEIIGPVRSVRPVDALIIDAYDGVFVYSGGQTPFKNAARDTGLVMSDEDTEMNNDTYYREPTRVAPWNLFFKSAMLQSLHPEQPAPQATFEFAAVPSAVAEGTAVTTLTVKYPQLTSQWDIGTGSFPWGASSEPAWFRTMDGTAHLQDGGDQVLTKNVLVLEVTHDNSFIDPKYGAIPKAELVNNSGVAHVFSDGFYVTATWSKGSSSDPIELKLASGEAVKLAIGNTWIELMDTAKSKLTVVPVEVPETEE